jgi:hypothetical protein
MPFDLLPLLRIDVMVSTKYEICSGVNISFLVWRAVLA